MISGTGSDDNEGVLHIPEATEFLEPRHQIVLCLIQEIPTNLINAFYRIISKSHSRLLQSFIAKQEEQP